MNTRLATPSRRLLCAAIAALIGTPAFAVHSSEFTTRSFEVKEGDEPKAWSLGRGDLLVATANARTLDVTATSGAIVNFTGASAASATGTAVRLATGSVGRFTDSHLAGSAGYGLALRNEAGDGLVTSSTTASMTRGSATGHVAGVQLAHGVFNAKDAFLEGTSGLAADRSAGLLLSQGKATLTGTVAKGHAHGALIGADTATADDAALDLLAGASHFEGIADAAIRVDSLPGSLVARVELSANSTLKGANDVAVSVSGTSQADVVFRSSQIHGDVLTESGGTTRLSLTDGATLDGRVENAEALTLSAGTRWNMTGPSDTASIELGGTLSFQPDDHGSQKTLTVHGDFAGPGGTLVFNTAFDAVGALASQSTDRVLVEGNVTTTAPILIAFHGVPRGVATDANANGVLDAHEGISLVQVAGQSTAGAFALQGGYVAAGPWQYTLHAFGPGTTDRTQSALASGNAASWDYRLGSTVVCDKDCGPIDPPPGPGPEEPGPGHPDPENPGPGDGEDSGSHVPGNGEGGQELPGGGDAGLPGDGGTDPEAGQSGGRLAVVPQLPSYLSAPAALATYADMLDGGLHQRLGDLRHERGDAGNSMGGDVFARVIGGQRRYTSSQDFNHYGFGFDQQVNALQVGAGLLASAAGAGTLRTGWALDRGTTRVTPHAVDGASQTKYTATGVSAWVSWQMDNGFYVDGIVAGRTYRGSTGTAWRGSDVAQLRARGRQISLEAGYSMAWRASWVLTPRAQVQVQNLSFDAFTDADGLDVQVGPLQQVTTRIGATLSRTADGRFVPYARVDASHVAGGHSSVAVTHGASGLEGRFRAGRVGHAWEGTFGAVAHVSPAVEVFGEGTYRHFLGSFGTRGWSATAGVRIGF